MKPLLIVIVAVFMPFVLIAQYNPTIRSARPGNTVGAYTIGRNVFQLQSGIVFRQTDFDEVNEHSYVFRHGTVLRLGILERFEIQGALTWGKDWLDSQFSTIDRSGVTNTQIGLRYNIRQQNKGLPAIGLQSRLLLRAQSRDYHRAKTGLNVVLMTAQKMGKKIGVNTNLGIRWLGNGSSDLIYALKFSYSLAPGWVFMADAYGLLTDFSISYDTGFFYVVNKDFKLDLSTGWQGSNHLSDWSLSTGLSWRVSWR